MIIAVFIAVTRVCVCVCVCAPARAPWHVETKEQLYAVISHLPPLYGLQKQTQDSQVC